MNPRLRRYTALATTVAVVGAGGLGVAQAQSTAKSSDATSTSAPQPGQGRHGHPGLSAAQLQKIATALGVSASDLKAAVDAARPAPPTGTKGDRGAGLASDLASALNVDVSKVQSILDANRPTPPAAPTGTSTTTRPTTPPPARPDNSALVSALAKGLGLDEATVKAALDKIDAAHRADHAARDAAFYKAVADKLGLSQDAVKTAFEANRPAPPSTTPTTRSTRR